jgi:hypothetical protein
MALKIVPKINKNALDASDRICACGCGREFKPAREWQVFYSDKCRARAHRVHCKDPNQLEEFKAKIRSVITQLEEVLGEL